jgi:hypothetical protein
MDEAKSHSAIRVGFMGPIMREVQCRAIIERANGVIVPSVNPGLCETCTHVQIVRSSKGSSFVLCRLSEVDPAFRRYPTLPVIACRGYERGPERPALYEREPPS